jgi:hypothetical protein
MLGLFGAGNLRRAAHAALTESVRTIMSSVAPNHLVPASASMGQRKRKGFFMAMARSPEYVSL